MSLDNIRAQTELAKKAMEQINVQSRIFETILHEAIKGAPNEDKETIQAYSVLHKKAVNLAKQGKLKEAQELIKNFTDASKNSK